MLKKSNHIYRGVIERYREFLPVSEKTPVVTLLEGNTPLIFAEYLSKKVGVNVYLKYEGLNPTASFKDRGMTVAISKALEEGARAVMCASTGNTSASAACYAAKAGIKCFVLIPEGKIAKGKLSQALVHQALVIGIKGNFDICLEFVKKLTEKYPITLVNSLNPYRIEGQKTAAFEICDTLGKAPEYLFIPVGNAGNITAYWKGFSEYYQAGKINSRPKMMGWQAEGAAPIVRGYPIEKPETFATAIRIGNPARWKEAESAARDSGGLIDMVSDEEIFSAYQMLASREGLFVEPASAASVAGLLKYSASNSLSKNDDVVCVLTGHGLKDPDTAMRVDQEMITLEAKIEEVEKAIFNYLK